MNVESRSVLAIYGSPRRQGNSATLLDECLRGVAQWTSRIEKVVLRDLKISPCLEIYACARDGQCAIKDDFQAAAAKLAEADIVLLASPIMFYTLSPQVITLMSRCQSFWVKRYWLKQPINPQKPRRQGVLIAAGATRGKRLFESALLSARYFFDALEMDLAASLCLGGLDAAGDARKHPEYLQQAFDLGVSLENLTKSQSVV